MVLRHSLCDFSLHTHSHIPLPDIPLPTMKHNSCAVIFRVDESLKNQFSHAAKNRDRHAAQLLRDDVRGFVCQMHSTMHDVWLRDQVQFGLDSAIYRNTGQDTQILRVVHAARQWPAKAK